MQNPPPQTYPPQPVPIAELLAGTRLDPGANITFQVFDILRDLIVSVKLRPGQRLSEKEIAAALDASKTPVREALIRLDRCSWSRSCRKPGPTSQRRDPRPQAAEAALRAHIGDLDRHAGVLFTDERLHGLIELPTAN